MPGYRIHIEGQVQGVGFRPYVFRMAKRLGLVGSVNNDRDGVHIHIGGSEPVCRSFINQLTVNPPVLANITNQKIELTESPDLDDFRIIESEDQKEINVLITPDLGLCEDCRMEIRAGDNRRKGYAFTTCTHCGPRYSIINAFPYDRTHTTMNEFTMCDTCGNEYNDSIDRRYFSQTNSCPQCGVKLSLLNNKGTELSNVEEDILNQVIDAFDQGRIIAVKGIGGFLLMCDATNESAIALLRQRKHRPSKPFAVLYPSLDTAGKDVVISAREHADLFSITSPIVILKQKKEVQSGICIDQISPGLSTVGVMLPYSPLLEIISQHWGKPLIATSGNISGSPIYVEDDLAIQQLGSVADFFLTNNRKILIPQDDSVVQFSENQRIVLRRSRGLAPAYLPNPLIESDESIFAAGSDMKSSFAIHTKGNLHVSQFLGDLENFDAQKSYLNTVHHLEQLLRIEPRQVLIDKHPSYFSSAIGRELANSWKAPVIEVQHHIAHFSAVLAENDLLETKEPILGVVWDGTGWGDDGNLWGSEFFMFSSNQFERIAHWNYFPHLLGNKMSREPRLSALSVCKEIPEAEILLQQKFTDQERLLYKNMLAKPEALMTSSMGRLFDAVASLLGLCDKTSYEGEAALLLETCATKVSDQVANYENESPVSTHDFFKHVCREMAEGTSRETLAYRFHVAVVNWIEEVARDNQAVNLAFSGGVFQNALLTKLITLRLGSHYHLFFHKQLSCNDECIGFGQLAYHQIQKTIEVEEQLKLENELI